jgi:hypothetical protein
VPAFFASRRWTPRSHAWSASFPDDVRALGAEARRKVAVWLDLLAAGGADLNRLTEAMRELSGMMDALTARLLLTPWDGPRRSGFKS